VTTLLEPHRSSESTTRISTDLEELWRKQFLTERTQTPADVLPDQKASERDRNFRRMTETVRFSGGVYDPSVIRFYEDIILELQKEVVRYRALWEEAVKASRAEGEELYMARQTVKPSEDVVRKLRSKTGRSLRVSAE